MKRKLATSKSNLEIARLEKFFGQSFEELQKIGLPNDADYEAHEAFLDLQALVYARLELQEKNKSTR
jgi:hypothetical protein